MTSSLTATRDMNILLIADNRKRAGLLRQAMENKGLSCKLRRIDPGKLASAYARQLGMYRNTAAPDLILVDMTDLDPTTSEMLRTLAFGDKRASAPIVILTSHTSERQLDEAGVIDAHSTVFAPTELGCFLDKMREHKRRRFMRALGVMYQLGPVLVRVPRAFSRRHLQSIAA